MHLKLATSISLLGLVTACGSQAHSDRNRAQMDAQLNIVDAATPDGAGREAPTVTLGPSAKQVGDQMRSTAAHPPSPK